MEERGHLLPARRPTSAKWRVSAYVLLLELVDALTYYGISQGFKNFMQAKLGYSQVGASSLRSTWTSFCDIVPLASAYVADEHLGRFRTILLAGAWYVGGICLLVVASHPVMLAEYNAAANVIFLIAIFFGIGLGNGGFDSNVVALGADQFSGDDAAQQRFFSYFYLSINVGSTVSYGYLAYLCVHGLHPIVAPEAGYFATFVLCGVALLLALGAFLTQSHRLIHTPPLPGALTRTAALFAAPALAPIVWGLCCFWLSFLLNFAAVFVNDDKIAWTLTCAAAGCILIGMSLWLGNATDKKVLASACLGLDPASASDLMQVLAILPFGVFQIVWNAVYDQLDANFQSITQQCDLRWDPTSGRHGAQVPGAMLGVFDTLGVAVWIPLLDYIVLPRLQTRYGIRAVDKVAAGLLLSSATMVWVGLVESWRRSSLPIALNDGLGPILDDGTQQPMNNLSWLMAVPGYLLVALCECLVYITAYDVFYAHVPSHLKSCAQALNSFMMAMGDNLASICTLFFAPYITDNLNDGHLEYMFFALALLATLNAIGFLLVMDSMGFGDMTTPRILADETTTAAKEPR